MRVLTLNPPARPAATGNTRAISSNNVEVRIAGDCPPNQMLNVRVVSASAAHLEAEALPQT